ncbi:protein-(glutamine-N5) methyltransferase, ribosomal protein L3-specific [Rhodopseudomonas sp. AAP120]|uniref:50S ribosomal protein L3 N(5)-glutamine methyltransferase n=1 Tax=Rhodopseudomonas sp. AAP120 TaxID=1523430 RepID=UPI0006B98F4A|nr:50S ribosomal protein L3 N(5)-glutamine methyltransferase [Rhodopseudomonas sp. AAP120]KPF99171.1 protein-(glutamine-N5) methyltransferase, ribosomal protein L3-specific [Rhodopseudomonas sp. AAP120]
MAKTTKAKTAKAKAPQTKAAKARPATGKKKPAARDKRPAKRRAAIEMPLVLEHDTFAVAPGELVTVLDFLRFAVSRFAEAGVVFAHGTTDPIAEAAFLIGEALHLHPDQFEMFATARVTLDEAEVILDLIAARIATRLPSAYLVNKIYMRGVPFYVDERVIVPRSFIGELLDTHFDGGDTSLIGDPAEVERVLDLCTGSGCLAILAARAFPFAAIDAVDLSTDALDVAARNVADHQLRDRITLHNGDLFAPLGDTRYDLIITNPPYVDAEGMDNLPEECLAEPAMAFDGGDDGLDIVRRILAEAKDHLTEAGGLLCEIGRGRGLIEAEFPHLPLLWLDSEDSEGEVFWIAAADL